MLDDNVVVAHTHPIGYKHIEAEGMNAVAASKFIDGVLYTLEFVSLYDRIPTSFSLISPRYSVWLGQILEDASYTQFYTSGVPISVTLENNQDGNSTHARHTQTIFSFKV